MNAAELLQRRAELLEELERIDSALKSLGNPTKAIKIGTRKNLRNTGLEVTVYEDLGLTHIASERNNGGYICNADLARLRMEWPDGEDDFWWVED